MDDLDVGRREDLTGEKRAEPVRLRRLTWAQTMKIETLKCASARFARRTSSQMMLQLVPELADGIRSGYYERAVKGRLADRGRPRARDGPGGVRDSANRSVP